MPKTQPITLIDDAREDLRNKCAAASPPVLTDSDLDRLLAAHQLIDLWAASTRYRVDDIVMPNEGNRTGFVFRCVLAGISSETEPVWDDVSTWAHSTFDGQDLGDLGVSRMVVGDNEVGWVATGPEQDMWDIEECAHAAWLEKAGRVGSIPTAHRGGSTYNFSDVYKHCVEMAQRFGGKYIK